jgi:hypothetical protein
MKKHGPILILAGSAVLSALIYLEVFTRPAGFLTLAPRSQVYQDYIYESPLSVRWLMIASFIALAGLYALGWYVARRAHGKVAWVIVIAGSLLFGVLLSYIYPIDASDLFNNIMDGRIRSVYGANPLVQVADQFKQDEFFPLVSWSYFPSTYGPVWVLLAGATSRLAGNDILGNVLAFKWLPGLFLLGSIALIAGVLKRHTSRSVLAGVLLLAWNPVVLYEVWGNGHNDIIMVFWVLLAVWAMLEKRYTLANLALVMGVLVKFIPALLLPVSVLVALTQLPDWRLRLRYLFLSALGGALLVFLAYAPLWEGPQVFSFARRASLFTTSLPAVAYQLAIPRLGDAQSASLVSKIALVLTLGFAVFQAWRASRSPSKFSFAQASFNILTFYLLVTCLWFQQWYAVWLVALAPVLEDGAAQLFGILFGFLALAKQFIMFPLLIYPNPRPPQPRFEIEFALGVLGFPWLCALLLLFKNRFRRSPPPPATLPVSGEGSLDSSHSAG